MTARLEVNKWISKYYFRSTSILDMLSADELEFFKSQLKLKKVRKGHVLFHEEQYPKGVYILKRGRVKMYHQNPSGTEQIVYVYTAGEMFGYRPLLCDETHPASAMTIEECGIYFMPATDFLKYLRRSPLLSNILLQHLSHEFTVLVNRIAAFGQKSVKERLALSLLILNEKYRRPGDAASSEITLSRADLAAFVGTTNETLARMLARFRIQKIIKVAGRKIIIMNEKALYLLTD